MDELKFWTKRKKFGLAKMTRKKNDNENVDKDLNDGDVCVCVSAVVAVVEHYIYLLFLHRITI